MSIAKKESVLVIDDDKLNIIALTRILGSDYQVYFESDSESGIRAAKTLKPDLILLDVVMPKMTGFEVIRILKADEETRHIPVIFLTGRRDVQDEEAGFILGAIDYITKPFSAAVVKLRVSNQLKIISQMRTVYNLSVEDTLTGLGNRRHFNNILNKEWQKSARKHTPLGFMIIDIDHFKKYNDTYGHLSGDAVLRGVADAIKANALSATDQIARWGGEEFAIILPETDLPSAKIIAENVRSGVEAAVFEIEDNIMTSITISIGVHSIIAESDPGYTLKKFISDTDSALYKAKNQGRNKVIAIEQPEIEIKEAAHA